MKRFLHPLPNCTVPNCAVALSTGIICLLGLAIGLGEGQPGAEGMHGFGFLKAFTVDSNLLASLSGGLVLYWVWKKEARLPRWLTVLRFLSAVSTTVTFATVALFLAPVRAWALGPLGYLSFFGGGLFFFHLVNPLLVLASFLCWEPHAPLGRWDWMWGMLPVLLYGAVYLLCVVALQCWPDFYGFLPGGNLRALFLGGMAMLGGTLFLSRLLLLPHQRSAETMPRR